MSVKPQHPGPRIPYYAVSPILGDRTRPPVPDLLDFIAVMAEVKGDPDASEASDRAITEAGRDFGRWLRRFTPSIYSNAVLLALKAGRCGEEED